MPTPQIIILDFGSQYTHLIARRIRQLGVLAQIFPPSTPASKLRGIKGLILSGGPASVHDDTAVEYDRKLFDLPIPILGLCYGHQLIAQHLGGFVKPGKVKEYSLATVRVAKNAGPLFRRLSSAEPVWMSHGDQVQAAPSGFTIAASSPDCLIAAMSNEEERRYGLQFHPEVAHTKHGLQIIENFVFKICGCRNDWSMEKYWRQIVADTKKIVGTRNIFLLVSGGVDSTVAFAILEKIFGPKRVFGLHVDNGFMRLNESKWIQKELAKAGFDDLDVIDASEQFLSATKGLIEPEAKRVAIGRTFLQVKDQVMASQKMNPRDWVLGQGTIYPDTIETGGTKHADKIKTHHNRVEEILKLMRLGALVEPLATLYKDEVREIGKQLGLPSVLLQRHPFPGPGLSIRTLCSDGKEKVENVAAIQKQLAKVISLGNRASFVRLRMTGVILPLRSVGVQGDNRTYRHPALLTGNTAWEVLDRLSVAITNQVHAVNRVVWLPGSQKIGSGQLKTKPALLTKDRLDLLRQVDELVTQIMRRERMYGKIWQFPVILAPLTLRGGETIILRPIESREAMTVNFYRMDRKVLNRLTADILKIKGIDLVLYDVTNKPPGTIEWE